MPLLVILVFFAYLLLKVALGSADSALLSDPVLLAIFPILAAPFILGSTCAQYLFRKFDTQQSYPVKGLGSLFVGTHSQSQDDPEEAAD